MTTPAWLSGKPLNEWFAISGTSGAGSAAVDGYSTIALREDTTELFIALAGGHGAGYDNRVVSIDLSQDSPSWTLRKAATSGTADVAYYADGTPCSRHTYGGNLVWIPERNRIMTFGVRFTYPGASTYNTTDGFNPTNNTWDAAGTWADIPNGLYGMCRGAGGNVWLRSGIWSQSANTCSSFSWTYAPRYQTCYDTNRDQLFSLQFGDGEGSSLATGIQSSKISSAGVQTAIGFNSSTALTTFITNQPAYSAMDYDPVNDKFYYMAGAKAVSDGVLSADDSPSRVYVITPNSGTTWDMSTLSLGAGTVTPDSSPSNNSGLNGRLKYIASLGGFVLLPQASSNLYFIRTSGATLPSFTLFSPNTTVNAPFSLGHCFKQGDVPSGSQVTSNLSDFQCIPKTTWPDGSIRIASIAGRSDLTASVTATIALNLGVSVSATALTTTNLRSTSIVASIAAGAFGSATWASADWDSPFITWVAGPKMSSWIYKKQIGSDAHLMAWIEVRLWSGNEIEILPWVENGFIRVTSPINKSATYSFAINGSTYESVVIDLKHHQRTPIINSSALSYWRGTNPAVTPQHDIPYLKSTEMVPTYIGSLSTGSSTIAALVTTYSPLAAGNITYDGDGMGATGYQSPIGLLPEYDMLYLVATSPLIYPSILRNGYSAGRYAIHYRDESTFRPLLFSSYPNLAIYNNQGFLNSGSSYTNDYTPAITGGDGPVWDTPHSPAVGYMPYLLTGYFYFMEEVQFTTTLNYLGHGHDNVQLRNGSQALVRPCDGGWQTRACAWEWRTRVMALAVTPDDDTSLRTEFLNSVYSNISNFYNQYVAQPNNIFGFVQSGTNAYDGATSTIAPWQQDFVTAAFGFSVCLDLPISAGAASNLLDFFKWTAKSIVGRLGAPSGGSGFPFMNADVYVCMICPTVSNPDYIGGTGPWRTSWADLWSAEPQALAYTSSPTAWFTSDTSVLAGEIMPGERALWGNIHPAIAYAARHGVPGAVSAYSRMTGASNYPTLTAAFNVNPVWSVAPYSQTDVAESSSTSSSSSASIAFGYAGLRLYFHL